MEVGAVSESLDELRAELARAFELMIWAQVYYSQLAKANFSPKSPGSKAPTDYQALPSVQALSGLTTPTVYMPGIPGILVDYWRARYRTALDGMMAAASQSGATQPSPPGATPAAGAFADVENLYSLLQSASQALTQKIGSLTGSSASTPGGTAPPVLTGASLVAKVPPAQ